MSELQIDLIKPNLDQPRKTFDLEALQELANSINQVGLLNSILVRPNGSGYEIVHGERRWRACQQIGLETIPADVRDLDDETAFLISFTENLQRDDLNPMDEARALQALKEQFDYNQTEMGAKIGKSQPWISGRLALLKLPEPVQDKVITRVISPSTARELSRIENPELQAKLADKATSGNLTVRQLEIEQRVSANELVDQDAYLEDFVKRLDEVETIQEALALEYEILNVEFERKVRWIISTRELGSILNILDQVGQPLPEEVDIKPLTMMRAERLATIPEDDLYDYFAYAAEKIEGSRGTWELTLSVLMLDWSNRTGGFEA